MVKEDDRSKFAPLAGAGIALGAAGYGIHRFGKGKEAQYKDAKKSLSTERDKGKRDLLVAQNEKLENESGFALTFGMAGMGFGMSLALMAALVASGVRLRRAALALAPALLVVAVYATYEIGIETVVVTSLLGVALTGYLTLGSDPRTAREVAAFRRFPTRRALPEPAPEYVGYRTAFIEASLVEQQKLLHEVDRLPPALERVLPLIGEGRPTNFFQLKRGLAYVAVVESDAYNATDYVTVLMMLDALAPRFVAKPLPVIDGKPVPNTGVRFKDDRAFTEAYWVEPAAGQRPDDVKAFLSPVVRDELLAFPTAWLQVEGNVMALTRYGDVDADATDRLVDAADVIFAEYGAEGGPTLLEPDDASVLGAPVVKKKKKKKKRSDSGAVAAPPA